MNMHWIIVPVVLPLLMAPLLLLCERWRPRWQWSLSLLSTLILLLVAASLVRSADSDTIGVYLLGNWKAPFGIVLVLDRLAAMLLLLTAVIALASQVAATSLATRGPHFYAFFQVQLAGLNGAFLTGDLFNLFVFFEVLLIASFALLLHDANGRSLRAGFHYVVINLVGSALFLIAAALLYGVVGTLNFADLAIKLPLLPASDIGLAQAAALLLLVVFGIKAALLPLGFWLPATYSAAPGPVAALFAIMTKVGLYGIVRMSMLVFGAGSTALTGWGAEAIFALGMFTTLFGAVSALTAPRLTILIGSLVLVSSGTLLAASALGEQALAGALYYMVHSTLAIALMFLVVHAIGLQRGAVADGFEQGPAVTQPVVMGTLFIIAAGAVVGLPPMAGFIGKALMLSGTLNVPGAPWFWAAVLGSGLLSLYVLARAGSRMFWSTGGTTAAAPPLSMPSSAGIALLVVASILWMALAGPASQYAADTAMQLAHPAEYINAVMQTAPLPAPERAH
ncbi:MAG: monovalent cation/H+ antiporter subunit D [Betaproteobacteria bacterium]